MASTTGQAIREELLKYGVLQLLGTVVGTSTSARIRDTARLRGAQPSTMYDDCWVRLTSGTVVDEISKVDYLDMDAGDLYVSPSFSGTPDGTYEVYRAGLLPDDLDRARDEALTRYCSQWALLPITEVTNGDFEDAIGTTWTATSSTIAINSTPLTWPVSFRASLRVTNSAANGYAASTSLWGRPGQSFYLYVPVSARTGTAEVIVRDVTNGANVTLSGTATSTGRGWSGIEVTGQVPSGGFELAIRLAGQGAADVIDWGPVHFVWQGQRRIALPARVATREFVGRVYRDLTYPQRGVNDEQGQAEQAEVSNVRRVQVADGVILQFSDETPMWNAPYFYQERMYYDALSTNYLTVAQRTVGDAATTLCPLDYVAAATCRVLAEWYMIKQPSEATFWGRLGQNAQTWLDVYERRFGPPQEPVLTRERSVYIPQLRV